MCTSIVEMASIQGSGKGAQGWFPVTQAVVSYDHPTHAMLEQSVNIDFVNPALGPGARVAVELTAQAARALAEAVLTVVERGDSEGYASPGAGEAVVGAGRGLPPPDRPRIS